MSILESVPGPAGGEPNLLLRGDNLEAARRLAERHAGQVDLIYLDPPFATGQDFHYAARREGRRRVHAAYSDRWSGGLRGYREWMAPRLEAALALLGPAGALYLHCDTRCCHVLRTECDRLLGEGCFRSQIVWRRTTSHPDAAYYGAVHDVILFYARPGHRMNPVRQALDPDYVEAYYRYRDPDGRRFMSDNLTGAGGGPPRRFGERGELPAPPGRHWMYDQEGIDRLLAEGRVYWTRNGVPRLKRYLDEADGVPAGDLWTDIQPLRSWHRREATGYATQKPLALLERILRASSNPGEVVADLFCGTGTTLVAAERLGRRWLGCDVGFQAVHLARRRLLDLPPSAPFDLLDLDGPAEGAPPARVRLVGGQVRLEPPSAGDRDWTERVDSWAVEWRPNGGPFRGDWFGLRRDGGPVPLASVEAPPGGPLCPRVRIYDAEGRPSTQAV